ncbi:hypothetical protein NCS52_01426200 [Fusarium sp. LHS14.1]|nr:hypothetical protein NCS52_01426200 [Fusarium sp. LHS14.1]
MNGRTKNGVYGVFLIGLIDLIFSLTRFLNVQLGDRNGFRSITMIELWSALDAYIGLIVACLPSLRPLLRRNVGSTNKSSGESSGRIPRPVRTDDNEFHEIYDIESMNGRGTICTTEVPQHKHDSQGVEPHGSSTNEDARSRSEIELLSLSGQSIDR